MKRTITLTLEEKVIEDIADFVNGVASDYGDDEGWNDAVKEFENL